MEDHSAARRESNLLLEGAAPEHGMRANWQAKTNLVLSTMETGRADAPAILGGVPSSSHIVGLAANQHEGRLLRNSAGAANDGEFSLMTWEGQLGAWNHRLSAHSRPLSGEVMGWPTSSVHSSIGPDWKVAMASSLTARKWQRKHPAEPENIVSNAE
ncbi:hypothetical protein MHYP_G00053840 [Metynnis hypsauchen]